MIALLRAPNSTVDVAAEVRIDEYVFESAANRSFGTARVIIPRGSDVLYDTNIRKLAGLRIKIPGVSGMSNWIGVQTAKADQDEGGNFSIPAMQIASLSKNVAVEGLNPPEYAPAGMIAEMALRRGIGARADVPLYPGTFVKTTPLIPNHNWNKLMMLNQVMTTLADLSGQEWDVDENGQTNWIAPIGQLYEPVLSEGKELRLLGVTENTEERVARVTPYDKLGRRGVAVVAPELADDPTAQDIAITVDSVGISAMEVAARARLALGRVPSFRVKVGLPPLVGVGLTVAFGSGVFSTGVLGRPMNEAAVLWSTIREGMLLRMVLPRAGLPSEYGWTVLGRVLSLAYGDNYPYPVLDIQIIRPWDSLTLPAARYGSFPQTKAPQTLQHRISDPLNLVTKITPDKLTKIPTRLLDGPISPDYIPEYPATQLTGELDATSGVYGVTPGTTGVNRPLVTDANGAVSVIRTPQLRLGAGAGTAVTATAADIDKTKVATWEGGSTANPRQTAIANAPATALSSVVERNAGDPLNDQFPSLQSVQAIFDELQTDINNLKTAQVNGLLGKLRPTGANIINT